MISFLEKDLEATFVVALVVVIVGDDGVSGGSDKDDYPGTLVFICVRSESADVGVGIGGQEHVVYAFSCKIRKSMPTIWPNDGVVVTLTIGCHRLGYSI